MSNSTTPINSDYYVQNDQSFYPIFKEISVYENIHPEYFKGEFYNSENKEEGVILSLAKEVQGKITIPTKFKMEDGKEYFVIALNSSFAAAKHTSSPL